MGNDKEYYPNIRRCLVAGFFMHIAHFDKERTGGHFVTFREGLQAVLHPSACLPHKPEWIVFHEFTATSRNFLRIATQIRGEWLTEVAPNYFDLKKVSHSNTNP